MKKFNFNTIEDFDHHIDVSIPGYSSLIEHILNLSTYFVKNDSLVYDLGASTGKLLEQLQKVNSHVNAQYVGIDNSKNLAQESNLVRVMDLENFEPDCFDFCTIIFTLQFLDIELRKILLRKLYSAMNDGGSIIIAEKNYIDDGFLQDAFSFCYYDFKLLSFSAEEILNKQIDLRYLMRPLSEHENEFLFKDTGFNVQSFWQSLQFKAWILTK